ncbi:MULTISPECIES: hypothetical protein [unclassified Burkholderia]|uniref:hypothetical protein n=1 Tax=unclassified Burkholderia TaxID=2613784 RepID=UPI00149582DB|nr:MULTISPECIES: hypothetical protein [unclassified Burkholderia]
MNSTARCCSCSAGPPPGLRAPREGASRGAARRRQADRRLDRSGLPELNADAAIVLIKIVRRIDFKYQESIDPERLHSESKFDDLCFEFRFRSIMNRHGQGLTRRFIFIRYMPERQA